MNDAGYDKFGYAFGNKAKTKQHPPDFSQADIALIKRVKPFTQTSQERIVALARAVEYVVGNGLPGDLVECGVWKGGSAMVMLLTLLELGATDRDLHLFDTYAGMPEPQAVDADLKGKPAMDDYRAQMIDENTSGFNLAPLEEVRENVLCLGYPEERIHFIKGKVEDTLPDQAPERIALLRLDTDWYSSTRHELEHLYPRLVQGGILIIDDYGHYRGARQAVDEYIEEKGLRLYLSRIDYTCRLAVKVDE